jgi:sugar phosphate isomerase/epimerase
MHIGVHTPPLYDEPLPVAVDYLADLGVGSIEPGVGGHPGDTHLPADEYLDDDDRQAELQALLDDHDMTVSALAAHDNPLGVVTCFSGLPAGQAGDATPNWIVAPWPPEHREALAYQWDLATDYWRDLAEVADNHGVDIAIEMHPNMLVHEPRGLARLREATNNRLGANYDPSHLYWQGIDVVEAVRYLGARDAIHHVHAKDTAIYPANVRTKGLLDAAAYDEPAERSWLFRTVGYGHGEAHWKALVSALRLVGYDGALSIEHEDALTSSREGLEKAVGLLQRVVLETQPGEAFWAD